MDQWATVLAAIAVLVGVAEVYSKTFGPTQAGINEAIIQGLRVPSRFRPLLNYAVSILVAAGATVVVAASVGAWEIVPGSVIVGALAAGVAANTHDTQKALTTLTDGLGAKGTGSPATTRSGDTSNPSLSGVVGQALVSPTKIE